MAKVIIGIHGLTNKPERKVHKQGWEDAIAEGLRKNCAIQSPSFAYEDVYWADRLHLHPMHREPGYTFDELYDDEPYIPAKDGSLKKYRESWLDRLRANASNITGNLIDGAKKVAGVGDIVADFALKRTRFLRDLGFYYDHNQQIKNVSGQMQQARVVLQQILEDKLTTHQNDQIMLIAHSMGSIIAYDVLRNLGRKPGNKVSVQHFVTVGSPLGLPLVKARVAEERDYDPTVRTPSIVTQSWVNFADRKDAVAFDAQLRDDYKVNASGIEVRDDLVFNDYEINGKHNYHKIFGYLRTPEMSEHIRTFLES